MLSTLDSEEYEVNTNLLIVSFHSSRGAESQIGEFGRRMGYLLDE